MTTRARVTAHRLAVGTAGATAVLIVAGGLVTNTGSALAVPDWPTTFGRNMFLYPLSEMAGGVLYEHTHRLVGALVGLMTLGLAVLLWVTERGRPWLRALGVAALVLVALQGVFGGLRVVLLRDGLALVHGVVAQAFFALMVALAVFTSRAWTDSRAPMPARDGRGLWRLSVAVTGVLYAQSVLGALATHAGWVWPHAAFVVVVVVAVTSLATRVLAQHADRPALVRPSRMLAGLLLAQLALGLGAYAARVADLADPVGGAGGLAFPVAHRVTGALLLGTAVVLALRTWRLSRGLGVASGRAVGVVRNRVPA